MYNRYVPQADGSFRRSRIQEPMPSQPNRSPFSPGMREPPQRKPPFQQQGSCPPQQNNNPPQRPNDTPPQRNPPPTHFHNQCEHAAPSVGSFLKGLLPQNFDVEDLMVVLLLLLMSGNSGSDQNGALITLVIYLFL